VGEWSRLLNLSGLYTGVTVDPTSARSVSPAGCPQRSWDALRTRIESGALSEAKGDDIESLREILEALDTGSDGQGAARLLTNCYSDAAAAPRYTAASNEIAVE